MYGRMDVFWGRTSLCDSVSVYPGAQYAGQALFELRDLPDSALKCWDQRLMALCPVRIVSHQNPSSSSVVAPDLPQTVATQLALHEFAEFYCWSGYYRQSCLKVMTLMLIPELEGSFSDSFQSGAGCPPSFYIDIFIFKNYCYYCCCYWYWYIVHMCVGSTCLQAFTCHGPWVAIGE